MIKNSNFTFDITKRGIRNGILVRTFDVHDEAAAALPALAQLRKMLSHEFAFFVLAPETQKELYSSLDFTVGFIGFESANKVLSRETLLEIRKLRFGAGIVFNNSFCDALCMRLAGIPSVYGFADGMKRIVFTKAFDRSLYPSDRTEQLLQMVYALGAPIQEQH